MIALYKDPKGESVFDKYEPPSFKTQQQGNAQQQPHLLHTELSATGTIDSLKKRIQELETMLAQNHHTEHEVSIHDVFYGVCNIIIMMFTNNVILQEDATTVADNHQELYSDV